MLTKYPLRFLLLYSFVLAILTHGVFLYQWTQGQYMTGINDGLSQMTPFKHLLYEQYISGEFFYSFDFGLGAGTFSELAYYFSTSIVFLITIPFVWLMEVTGLIPQSSVLFWANLAVFISVIRLTFVLFITARLFMYMKLAYWPSLLGAAVYGASGMYFRHAVYWEFFADAFLWLPLLILGIEKIFREQKPGWFLVAVSISFFDNFYFAYINFLLAGIYILFRLFIPLSAGEQHRRKKLKDMLISGIIAFGIGAIAFVPAVYAYLNNHRPAYEQAIPIFGPIDNILYTSRYILLPALFMLFLFIFRFYGNKTFRLFALLGTAGIIMHLSPFVSSAFNGFSAPQYRWEYFISFAAGGAIASGLSMLRKISRRNLLAAAGLTIVVYLIYALLDPALEFALPDTGIILGGLGLTLALVFAVVYTRKPVALRLLIAALFLWVIVYANFYQHEKILKMGDVYQVSEELMTGAEYDDREIRELLEQIHAREDGGMYRIEWMEGVRNNTPIVQDFQGLSAYSSILNQNLLYFYLYDMEIDMERESVSRYATLGNRANLFSLVRGKYIIRPADDTNTPFGFKEILSSGNYLVYENENVLPFARGATNVYQETVLDMHPPLVREHAILNGIVLDTEETGSPVQLTGDITSKFSIEGVQADYEDGILEVTGETGGIDLIWEEPSETVEDLYVSFKLINTAESSGFDLTVNNYTTSRKANDSIYKTFVDDLTIRVPAEEKTRIRVPEGRYYLTELQMFSENYEILQREAAETSGVKELEIDGSRVEILYDNTAGDDYLSAVIPYEIGWSAEVNGEKTDVLKANYAFVGVPIEEGENRIIFTYRPPFFIPSLIVSLLSILIGAIWIFRYRRRV
ncbi:YfhO family protein [Planococcus beigongshangi]|uniref:YfhO family protein n=1 Tax=Planococcus beigongshangi TaxID=2782536 RepID=UPI00193BDCE5|nr:YfhO family protein [Planococcus beigongshangi]